MKRKVFVILATLIFVGVIAGIAYADTAHFTLEPTASGQTWQGVNAPGDGAGDHYGRNIFWDFSDDPLGSGNPGPLPDAAFYGVIDRGADGPTVKLLDSVTRSNSDVKLNAGRYGLKDKNKSGYATFNIGNLDLAPSNNFAKYFYLEMDLNVLKLDSYVQVSLTGTGASVVDSWANGGATQSGNTWKWLRGATDLTGTVNAWFMLDKFASAEALKIDFFTPNTDGAKAQIDNLHIASTPEPISAALFLLGGGALAVRQYRKKRKV